MPVTDDPELDAITPPAPADNGAGAGEQWRTDSRGREYIPARDRRGNLYRVGKESIAEALARDAAPAKDQRPRRKSKPPKKPPAPAKADLKELEKMLVEAFTSPSFVCATFGDEWGADHFTRQGPVLARNLIVASEHNPWLRRKLEEMAVGGELPIMLISMIGVAGALIGYAAPPLIYWLNLPVPDRARAMYGIPDRKPPIENAKSTPAATQPEATDIPLAA